MNSESSRTVILSIASSRSSWVRTAIACVSFVGGSVWMPGALRAFGLGLLVADLRQGVAEVPDVGRQQAGKGPERGLHAARQLGEEDLARRQAGEAPDRVGVDRPVAEDGPRDRHD